MGSVFDLSQLTFDEFVSFFFDRDVVAEEHWYQDPALANLHDFDDEDIAPPRVIVGHMTRLFTNFADVTSGFSVQQIDAAIWAMFTYGSFRLQKHHWLPSALLPQRLEYIRAMYFVYSDYVAKSTVPVMENCFSMWWDFVANGFWEQLLTDSIEQGDVSSLRRTEGIAGRDV
jgi:hypothetical protein